MRLDEKSALIAGAMTAIGASACCLLPLTLMALGLGGSWLSALTALAPYRPLFIGLTAIFLGLAFYRLYLEPPACIPGEACAELRARRRRRVAFRTVTGLALALVGAPRLLPLFS